MKKFKVKVTSHGIIFLPNGRKVRTPVELNIVERQLEVYKLQFKSRGLSYTITEVTEDDDVQEVPSISKKVIIEELATLKTTAGQKTFLDKLICDEEKN